MIGKYITITGASELVGRWQIAGFDNSHRFARGESYDETMKLELRRVAGLPHGAVDDGETPVVTRVQEGSFFAPYRPVRLDELRNAVRALCVEFPDQAAQAMRDRKMRGFFVGKLMDRYGDKVHHATYVEIVHAEFRRAMKKEEVR